MIATSSLPHRVSIVVRSAGAGGARYGNRDLVETRRYARVPCRVDDVSSDEDLDDRERTDTFYDVILRASFRGEVLDFDAKAQLVWHDRGDVVLELDAEPVLVDVGPRAKPDHFELRARRTRG